MLFTDGVKYLVDKGGAYRLLDLIAFAQRPDHPAAAEAFQLWTLRVTSTHTGPSPAKTATAAVYSARSWNTPMPSDN